MIPSAFIISGLLAASSVAAAQLQLGADLLAARQDLSPGSPVYNCHDNCGEAILESKRASSSSVCDDSVFLIDYAACLQCAGPDNADIWDDYGPPLEKVAAACGLATTPLAGSQAPVGPAVPAASTSAGGSGSGSAPAPTSTGASASSTPESSSAVSSTAASATESTAPPISSAPSGTVPSTSSPSSSTPVAVTAAATAHSAVLGLAGAMAFGAVYALAN